MSVTIKELVALPFLQTRFLAGRTGGERAVLWAHTCELPHPWEWLGTGDLLLADGLNFPASPEEQVAFVRALARAALSGLALAEGMHAPPLTDEAIAAADELDFPVLETAYSVPFVTLARTVADSNSREAAARLSKIIRVYDVLRRAHEGHFAAGSLLGDLGTVTGTHLHVVDTHTGEVLLPGAVPLTPALRQGLLDALEGAGRPLPTFVRVTVTDTSLLALPVGNGGRGVLLAEPVPPSAQLDLVVLQHLATISHLEVERREAVRLRRVQAEDRLLGHLIDGSIDLETAESQVTAMGLRRRPWRAASISPAGEFARDGLQTRLRAADIPHLATRRGDELLALLPAEHATADDLGVGSGNSSSAGVSEPVHSLKAIGDAVRQARWAREAARSEGRAVVVYGEQSPTFLPRTVVEGEAAVARILGPLIAYDQDSGSQLVHSLEVFLDSNRSWKEGAQRLGIHRQTLMYRMRRVEELTGRELQSSRDQADLYLALRTFQMLGGHRQENRDGRADPSVLLGTDPPP